jgi:hypothetical protein
MAIDRYIVELQARLGATDADASEELRAHLEDAAHDLERAGVAPDESEREAIRRLGSPEEVAVAFAAERREYRRGSRPLIAALLAATTLAILGGSAVAAANTPAPAVPSHGRAYPTSRGVGSHGTPYAIWPGVTR